MKRKRQYDPLLGPSGKRLRQERPGDSDQPLMHAFIDTKEKLLIPMPELATRDNEVPCLTKAHYLRNRHSLHATSPSTRMLKPMQPAELDARALLFLDDNGRYLPKPRVHALNPSEFNEKMLHLGVSSDRFDRTRATKPGEEAEKYQSPAGPHKRREVFEHQVQAGQDNPDLLVRRFDGSFVALWPKLVKLNSLQAVIGHYEADKVWIKSPDFIYREVGEYRAYDAEHGSTFDESMARIFRNLTDTDTEPTPTARPASADRNSPTSVIRRWLNGLPRSAPSAALPRPAREAGATVVPRAPASTVYSTPSGFTEELAKLTAGFDAPRFPSASSFGASGYTEAFAEAARLDEAGGHARAVSPRERGRGSERGR